MRKAITNNKNTTGDEKKPSYIFGDVLGNALSKVDLRTQFEASMLSVTMMMVGLVLTIIYIVFYIDFQVWFKIVFVVNGLFGILFMLSNLVTTFQSYRSYMEAKKMQEELSLFNQIKGGTS